MCGIVGYVGDRSCRELLLHGLERLEYRGYDSAGLSLLGDGRIESVRSVGNLSRLREAVDASESNGGAAVATQASPTATTGIGHTRWATHGRPPSATRIRTPTAPGRVHIVLNGIIENYVELRAAARGRGPRLRVRDGRRGRRAPDRAAPRRARPRQPRRGDAPCLPGAARSLRVRRDLARTSRTRSSARARSARWSWASARASTSSPRRSPPSCARPATCSSSTTTRS